MSYCLSTKKSSWLFGCLVFQRCATNAYCRLAHRLACEYRSGWNNVPAPRRLARVELRLTWIMFRLAGLNSAGEERVTSPKSVCTGDSWLQKRLVPLRHDLSWFVVRPSFRYYLFPPQAGFTTAQSNFHCVINGIPSWRTSSFVNVPRSLSDVATNEFSVAVRNCRLQRSRRKSLVRTFTFWCCLINLRTFSGIKAKLGWICSYVQLYSYNLLSIRGLIAFSNDANGVNCLINVIKRPFGRLPVSALRKKI